MTVQVVGYRVHPSVCPCAGSGVVAVAGLASMHSQTVVQVASRLTDTFIACPQCVDATDLFVFLARHEAVPAGPGAA